MDIADWRKKIDVIDLQIVALISERAQAAQEIGKLKVRDGSAGVRAEPRARDLRECARSE